MSATGTFIERHNLYSEQQRAAAAETMARVGQLGIEVVRLVWPDQHGLLRGKSLSRDGFASALRGGIEITMAPFFFDTANAAGDNSYTLVGGTAWKGLGRPAGSKGYRYRGAGTASDPCRVVLVKQQVVKAICAGPGVTLAPPFAGDIGIVLSLGTTDRYCAQFGGDEARNDATLTKRKNAPALGPRP